MTDGGARSVVRAAGALSVLGFGLLGLGVLIASAGTVSPGGAGSPDSRARRLVAAMSLDEKIGLLHTKFGVPLTERPQPAGALGSAGFNPGLSRLGIPALQETDAGLGIANPKNEPFDATALPASLALGATFDIDLARQFGSVVGAEARAMGFNVVLGPGANLVREPRGGRNFEYVSEDPLLTGMIAGAEVSGIQSRRVVATLKHFAVNAQENGRIVLSAQMAEAALRESDLLAFEIAMARGAPHALMAAYNRVNGTYASENAHLLTEIVKTDWAFPGWVMADWGGTHSTVEATLAGLDQESGEEDDEAVYFDTPLKAAVESGRIPQERLDDMVTRLLRAQIAAGVVDDPPRPGGALDLDAHARVAREVATRGIVLLKNANGILPLRNDLRKLLVVGGHADIGVLSGGGSSQVAPKGGIRFEGIPAQLFYGKPRLIDPSPPLAALRETFRNTDVSFDDGHDVAATARLARDADAVVVFADRWTNESLDLEGLDLPFAQNDLIAAIAAANPHTIVVLETPGGVRMPWLDRVPGVVEAWYPGERGGEAITDVLTGKANPGGRLPVSFPASEAELPRPTVPARGKASSYPREALKTPPFDIDYNIEGAAVGYKWYLKTRQRPLFPFGFGLSYTRFAVSAVAATATSGTIAVSFDVENTGDREGRDIPQVYLEGGGLTRRLVGWGNTELKPGETKHVTVDVDPRLIARFDVDGHGWRIDGGRYTISVRPNALDPGPTAKVDLAPRLISAAHRPCGLAADTGPPASTGAGVCIGSR